MKSQYDEGDEEDEPKPSNPTTKKSNVLPLWGNERTMNMNPLILTNIQSSHYFKVNLYELKTYHEVIDEIYYKVAHLEPWEKGSRKTAGQTGMCGGVRGVGAGGIVSTAYCLLYKLFTLKLTRKQLNGLITHTDSPYIRALGFMYIRYSQPPADLWDWYDEYLDDPEELDVKAGGGQTMTMGNILKNFLCKLEWFSTLFPRIPVPIQQKIERNMNARYPGGINTKPAPATTAAAVPRHNPDLDYEPDKSRYGRTNTKDRLSDDRRERARSPDRDRRRGYSRESDRPASRRPGSRERDHPLSRDRDHPLSRDRDRYGSRDKDRLSRDKDRHSRDRGSSREQRGSWEREAHHHRHNGEKRRNRSRSPHKHRSRYH
uniref:Pre-mRNA-splicing factor 38 n=2 Tax=Lygus hesperus TaxID=30085 RepID=A0A146M9R8_LYGHE